MGKQRSFLDVSVSAYLGVFSRQYLAVFLNKLVLHFKLINTIFLINFEIFSICLSLFSESSVLQNCIWDRMNRTAQHYNCICINKKKLAWHSSSLYSKTLSPFRTDWSPPKNLLKYSVAHNNLKAMHRHSMKNCYLPQPETLTCT